MTTNEINDQEALQVGRSILLIGLKRAMAILQTQAETLETQLNGGPSAAAPGESIRPAMQRTMALIEEAEMPTVRVMRKYDKRGSGSRNYWAKLTPEERSKEMKRRMRLGERRKRAAGL